VSNLARSKGGGSRLVQSAFLGLSIARSFRKLQSDVLEIQWSVENWVATQFSEASVASARAPSDASGTAAAFRRREPCKRRVATQFSEACAASVRGPFDPNGSAAVKNVIRGGSRLARASSILLPAGTCMTPLLSPCGFCLSVGGHNMAAADDGQTSVRPGCVASAVGRNTGGKGVVGKDILDKYHLEKNVLTPPPSATAAHVH